MDYCRFGSSADCENESEGFLCNSAKTEEGCKSLVLSPPQKKINEKTFWSEKCKSVPFFSVIVNAYKWGLFVCLWLPESSNASSGECNWYHPQTHERVFKPSGADCGGMRLRLLPIFLFDQFFCSLSSSVPAPLSHKFSPHYSKDLKHEIGLPACGCQILWCWSTERLDRHRLTRGKGVMQWVTSPFKCCWCELTVTSLNSVEFRM